MISEVIMPKLGQTMEEGTIAKWHKAEGDKVEKGEVLLEITTDKATLEVESYARGILRKILAKEGDVVPITQVIAYIGDKDDEIPVDTGQKGPGPGVEDKAISEAEEKGRIIASPRARKVAREKEVELSHVTGTGPGGRIEEKDVLDYLEQQPEIKISPLARKIAREKGIDIYAIKGTGPNGRITKEDVLAYKPQERLGIFPAQSGFRHTGDTQKHRRKIPSLGKRLANDNKEIYFQEKPAGVAGPGLSSELVPLSPMRKIIAQRMLRSKTTTPHFYLKIEIDMSACVRERENLKQQGKKISYNDFIIRACALSIRKFPLVAAFYTEAGIQMRPEINIGLAVGLDDGLVVPVIKSADGKDVEQIAAESQALVEKARSKKLTPDDYSGGVLTISNLGMFDIIEFAPIINPGESAIIGVGKITDRTVLKGESVTTQKIMVLAMSCDHRVIYGVLGAKFLQKVKQLLEEPSSLFSQRGEIS